MGLYFIVVESLEDLDFLVDEYYVVEVILYYVGIFVISNLLKLMLNFCIFLMLCIIFNCLFLYYLLGINCNCLMFDNEIYSEEIEKLNFREVLNVKEILYYNFGFLGDFIKNRGFVNGC